MIDCCREYIYIAQLFFPHCIAIHHCTALALASVSATVHLQPSRSAAMASKFWSVLLVFSAVLLVTCVLVEGQGGENRSNQSNPNVNIIVNENLNQSKAAEAEAEAEAQAQVEVGSTIEFYRQFMSAASGSPSQVQVLPVVGDFRFGQIDVFDAAITSGPYHTSTVIGRSHGALIYHDQRQLAWENVWTAVFNDDSPYGSSTLVFRGYQPSTAVPTTYALVGGTGFFRCALGSVLESVVSADEYVQTVFDQVHIASHCMEQ